MNMKYFFYLLLILGLNACTITKKDDGKSIFYDDMKKCTHLIDLFDEANYEIIPLEIDSMAIPAVGMKFFAYKDYFLISDNQYAHTIFLYNDQGKFLYSIGSKGKGPHEYSTLADFSVYQDTVSIADAGSSEDSFLHYNLDGSFLGKTKIPNKVASFARNKEGEYIINSGRNIYQAKWQITRYTNDLKTIEQCWKLTENENNIPIFEYNFSNSDTGIFFHEAFNNQLHKLVDNRFEPSYQLLFDEKNDFTKVRNGNFMQEVEKLYQEGFYLLNGYVENDSYVFLSLDYMKDAKNEKQVLGVYHKNVRKGKKFEMPSSSVFMGNLKDDILYLMVTDNFIEEELPDIKKTKDTDIFILKVIL